MKVLMLNTSANPKGHTDEVLKIAAEEFSQHGIESEVVWLGAEHIKRCDHCRKCLESGRCVMEDAVNTFVEKARESDGFIFASPLNRVKSGGSIENFLSRIFFMDKEAFRLKPAATLTLALRTPEVSSYGELNKYFMDAEMMLIASKYWNLRHSGNDPKAVREDKLGVDSIRRIVRNMIYCVLSLEAARQAGIDKPEPEKSIFDGWLM